MNADEMKGMSTDDADQARPMVRHHICVYPRFICVHLRYLKAASAWSDGKAAGFPPSRE
jgi:hypothetical protein